MSRDDVQRWKDKYLENIEQQERLAGMLLIMLSVDMLLDNLRSVLHIAA